MQSRAHRDPRGARGEHACKIYSPVLPLMAVPCAFVTAAGLVMLGAAVCHAVLRANTPLTH